MTCSECGHDDMVHFMYAGCCGHLQCPCEGNSTTESRCREDRHGDNCWWAIPRQPKAKDEAAIAKVLALHLSGVGTRSIARQLGIKRPEVMRIIRTESLENS